MGTAPLNHWKVVEASGKEDIVELRIRLTPKSSKDAVEDLTDTPEGPAIKVRVRAIPENGAANKALVATVAKWLRLPKSSISVSAGVKSRTKQLAIVIPKSNLERTLDQLKALIE